MLRPLSSRSSWTDHPVTPFSSDEVAKLLNVAANDQLGAFYTVAIAIGLRPSEALALGWADVDLKAGTVKVRRTLDRQEGRYVFNEPKSRTSRRTLLQQRAGVPHHRLYDSRHTAASLLLAQGVSPRVVMEVLGHSSFALTMDTYTHVMEPLIRDAAGAMDRALRGH